MKKVGFVVGELPFVCELPEGVDVKRLLPSFQPFLYTQEGADWAFRVECTEEPLHIGEWSLLEEFCNDLGQVRLFRNAESFLVELSYEAMGSRHWLQMDSTVSVVKVRVAWEDPSATQALTSMLRIAYSQRVLHHDGFSIHASTVVKDGKGFLFLGKSGTGKSTHSRLWKEVWKDVELLNDDNPIVRRIDGRWWVYGSPWSGKTPCYKQRRAPLQGMVRLRQAPENRWLPVQGVKAWTTVYPSCAVIYQEGSLYERLRNTLNRLVTDVTIGRMECLPNTEAAELSWKNMK